MANTFTAKSIDGQLPNAKGTLYTVPGSTTTYLKSVQLFNNNAATQTVILYKKGTSSSRAIAQFSLPQNGWASFDTNMVLNTGDLLEAVTTTAAAVDYVASFVEEA